MIRLRIRALIVALIALMASVAFAAAPESPKGDAKQDEGSKKGDGRGFEPFKPEAVVTNASVTISGRPIPYQAIAGTLIVHPKGWDDVPRDPKPRKPPRGPGESGEPKNPTAEASMFYVAYFKSGGGAAAGHVLLQRRPGLLDHVAAHGRLRAAPRRHVDRRAHACRALLAGQQRLEPARCPPIWCSSTPRARASAASPARTRRRRSSASIRTPTRSAEFITQFLSKYGRWNSPKYLFGESYGTPRSAVVVNQLEADRSIDFNGVILLSQILNFDLSPDRPTGNPGIDLPYQTVLPTYAATAWYHHKLPAEHASLEALLTEVEQFAMGDYARALAAGSDLSASERAADGREAASIHRAARRLHPQGGPAHRRRRVPPEPAGRQQSDHRAARYTLLRAGHRSVEPARRLRPAVERPQLRLRVRFQ